jgi:hypothetical protein
LEEATEEFLETFGEFAVICLLCCNEGIFAGVCLHVSEIEDRRCLFVDFLDFSKVVDDVVFDIDVF